MDRFGDCGPFGPNGSFMKRSEFRLFHPLRVRWAEVDVQQVVFNPHYLMYLDTAVSDYWRALAVPYDSTMKQLGGDFYAVKATVEFHASARMDDRLDVGLRCARLGRSSMVYSGAIFRGEQHLVSGEIVHVFADPSTQTSRPIPEPLRACIEAFEAGQSVTELRIGQAPELLAAAHRVRQAVFVQEQGIDPEIERDAADAEAQHAVLSNRMGQPVAAGRLLPSQGAVSFIGRLAVLHPLRGRHLGRLLLQSLIDLARQRGDMAVCLNAQQSAEPFYRRLGFLPEGAPFVVAGIEHQTMRLRF